jgi:hypothetical protein
MLLEGNKLHQNLNLLPVEIMSYVFLKDKLEPNPHKIDRLQHYLKLLQPETHLYIHELSLKQVAASLKF